MHAQQGESQFAGGRKPSDFERFLFHRQAELILDLIEPQAGERVLVLRYGQNDYLPLFKEKWCSVTVLEAPGGPWNAARKTEKADFVWGEAEDLPFSDDEFDVVTLINFLEASHNPDQVIREAIRVCRGRVFIGLLNNFSFAGTKQKLKQLFGFPLAQDIRFYHLTEIKRIVGRLLVNPEFTWGSVIYFPSFVYSFFEELEEALPVRNNPLGAFLGLVFPVRYTYRTAQNPVMKSFPVTGNARSAAPGWLQETPK